MQIGTRSGSLAALWLATAVAAGCGSEASSEVSAALRRGQLDLALRLYDAQGARDPASLRAIAQAALVHEAQSGDARRRDQVFTALRASGTAARSVLERLTGSRDPHARVRALELLVQLGDASARSALLEHAAAAGADSEIEAAAVAALDPAREDDARLLRARLESPSAQVRRAATARLAHAPAAADTLAALVRRARHDPELGVRLAALRGLENQGAPGVAAIEARLADADAEVRAGAAVALASADVTRARVRLAALLGAEPTPEAIESARALIAIDPGAAPAEARGLLARALVHADGALRGRAAVALMSLRDAGFAALAAERAALDPSRSVRVCLALALPESHAARARLLRDLTATGDAVAGQAAAELARSGDGAALGTLRQLLRSEDPRVRRVSVRALGHDLGRPDEVRAALRDHDTGVRIAAAAAILSAASSASRPWAPGKQ